MGTDSPLQLLRHAHQATGMRRPGNESSTIPGHTCCMQIRPHHAARTVAGRAPGQRSDDLLQVWLDFLGRIEGPRRRRAEEFRQRRDNPRRRVSNRGSHLRAFHTPR